MFNFGEMAREVFKERAVSRSAERLSTFEWGLKYASHFIFRDPAEKFHPTLCRMLDDTKAGRNIVIICPRGYAKTTWIQIFLMRCICEKLEPYILLIMDTSEQAQQSLETVADEITTNPLMRATYGDAVEKGTTWNKNKIVTKAGVCVEALGTGKKVRGRRHKERRPTLIIVDDPQNDEGVASPAQRQKDWDWLNKALIKCGESGITRLFLIGTVLNKDCMVCRAERQTSFDVIKFRAVIKWPKRMDKWEEWRKLYTEAPVVLENGVYVKDLTQANEYYDTYMEEMSEGAEILWPAKESLYDLMLQWGEDKLSFMSEKQNDAWNPHLAEFNPEWFSYDRKEIWYTDISDIPNSIVAGFVDLAHGKETKAHDYTATIVGHWDGTHLWVECDIEKRPVNEVVANIVEMHKQVKFAAFGCEEQGFQFLAMNDLEEKCIEENIDFPIVPMPTFNVKKSVRIARLATYLKRGFFKFRRGCSHTELLIEQLYEFPNPRAHDDGPDALEGLIRLLYMLVEDGLLGWGHDDVSEEVVGKIG